VPGAAKAVGARRHRDPTAGGLRAGRGPCGRRRAVRSCSARRRGGPRGSKRPPRPAPARGRLRGRARRWDRVAATHLRGCAQSADRPTMSRCRGDCTGRARRAANRKRCDPHAEELGAARHRGPPHRRCPRRGPRKGQRRRRTPARAPPTAGQHQTGQKALPDGNAFSAARRGWTGTVRPSTEDRSLFVAGARASSAARRAAPFGPGPSSVAAPPAASAITRPRRLPLPLAAPASGRCPGPWRPGRGPPARSPPSPRRRRSGSRP
jgi:hypothetical protein